MTDVGTATARLDQTLNDLSVAVDAIDSFRIRDTKIDGDTASVILEIDTTIYPASTGGLPVKSSEYVTILIGVDFPWTPPTTFVTHRRWIGFPHVLQGSRLCLYLDPASQWDPATGVTTYLTQLFDWFAEAIAGEFDPKTSLYHPVGGVLHRTPGAPTLVVEDPLPFDDDALHFQRVLLRQRSPQRIDVVAWRRKEKVDHARTGLLVALPDMLPLGAGCRLSDLTAIVGNQQSNGARKRLLQKLRQTSQALNSGDPLQIVIAVPNPANNGQSRFHLIAGHVDYGDIQDCLNAATQRGPRDNPAPDEPKMTWLYVDDQRPGLSVRRDTGQPAEHLWSRSVELWGCGALGSWMAELLVRAGISQITLRDPGHVTKGLLVRQNYGELDVGRPKAEALADRLRSINSNLDVRPVVGICERAISDPLTCDVVIDATVSTSVATAIENAQEAGQLPAPLIQIATDSETATLGILTICQPRLGSTTNDIDQALRARAETERDLAPFLIFWDEEATPPLTPTLGCSVPTFPGSAADLAAIASIGFNLASVALGRSLSGGYLFASPHSPHRVPARTDIDAEFTSSGTSDA